MTKPTERTPLLLIGPNSPPPKVRLTDDGNLRVTMPASDVANAAAFQIVGSVMDVERYLTATLEQLLTTLRSGHSRPRSGGDAA